MDSLSTGDVILFDRDLTRLKPLVAVLAGIRKYTSRCRFDHAGVILDGAPGEPPFVAEIDDDGNLALTPYDERVTATRSRVIAVRRLKRGTKARDDVEATLRPGPSSSAYESACFLSEAIRVAAFEEGRAESAAFVTRTLVRAGILTGIVADSRIGQRVSDYVPRDALEGERRGTALPAECFEDLIYVKLP